MNCLIKHSLSFVLESIVKRLIDNINDYSYLITTEDWRLLMELNEAVGERRICRNECLGCLEFFRMMNMFSNFENGILSANSKSEVLITELRRVFSVSDELGPIALALDLVASPGYVRLKIRKELLASYDSYVAAMDVEISRLAIDHFYHEQAKCHDAIRKHGNLGREQVISYQLMERPSNKKLFYIDQNVVSYYAKEQSFKRQVENFKEKVGCKFVYSPYVIEDGFKMSRVRLSEYFDAIKGLTENTMFVRSDGNIVIATEDVQVTFDRVLLWRNATRAAEDLKVQEMYCNSWQYPHYSRGSKLSERINKNIDGFLSSLGPYLDERGDDFDVNDYESDKSICRRLSAAAIGKNFSLRGLVHRSIRCNGDAEYVACIGDICEFLDLINYQTESLSELSKIRSSLQDKEHLKIAWKADYFVTDDKRLRKRGEFIYSALGLDTRFISITELKEKIASEFKD